MRKQTKIAALVSAAALLTIGAAMTSFAAWSVEDGQWVYLDSDGEKVEYEWKKSGADWYYLGEGGYMVTDQLIDDDDDIYYVGTDGRRVINDWRSVPNDDGDEVNDTVVDTLWYYFGSTGKAYKMTELNSDDDSFVKKTVPWSGGSNVFFFDADGRMASGWVEYLDKDGNRNLYYLGDETEGWARAKGVNGSNGWYYLELPESMQNGAGPNEDAYEDEEWFYFQSSGKAYRAYAAKGESTVSKYIDNLYYTFDTNGVLQDKWFSASTAANASSPVPAAFTGVDGNKAGWVYTTTQEDDDTSKWFYLVNVSNGKMVAFGSGTGNKDLLYAKSIGGKTYLFNGLGEMQSGVVTIAEGTATTGKWSMARWNGSTTGVIKLQPGTYLFSKAAASQGDDGRMLTGKQTYTDEGETSTYYFRKADETVEDVVYSKGSALKNEIKDNSLYGHDGKRVEAEDGNSYDLVNIATLVAEGGKPIRIDDLTSEYTAGTFVVSSAGKVRKSGNVTIDGVVYTISNYVVTGAHEKGDSKSEVDSTWVTAETAEE